MSGAAVPAHDEENDTSLTPPRCVSPALSSSVGRRRALSPSSVNQEPSDATAAASGGSSKLATNRPLQTSKISTVPLNASEGMVKATDAEKEKKAVPLSVVGRRAEESSVKPLTPRIAGKENVRTASRKGAVVLPWMSRSNSSSFCSTASSQEAGEDDSDSPPTVALTATNRKTVADSAAKPTDRTSQQRQEEERDRKEDKRVVANDVRGSAEGEEKPRWTPRSRVSDTPRGTPPVSPRSQRMGGRGDEGHHNNDDGEPILLESTARPSAAVKRAVETAASTAKAEKGATEPKAVLLRKASSSSLLVSPRRRVQEAAPDSPPTVCSDAATSATSVTTTTTAATATATAIVPSTTAANADAASAANSAENPSKASRDGSPDAQPASAPLATPRGSSMASRVDEIRARLAASRQSSSLATPRLSVGSTGAASSSAVVAAAAHTGVAAAKTHAGGSVDAAALAETASLLKDAKETVKAKDKEVAQLSKEKAKLEQTLEKLTKKCDDTLAKLEAEKAAFAAFKKDALTQKLEAQKELRQAQATAKSAQAAQEKLQREVEKLKQKAAAFASKTASAATTPMATPRHVPLSAETSLVSDAGDAAAAVRAKALKLEKEKDALRLEVAALQAEAESVRAAAEKSAAAAVEKAAQEHAAALKSVQDEREALVAQVAALTQDVAAHVESREAKEEALKSVMAELEDVKRALADLEHAQEQQQQAVEQQEQQRREQEEKEAREKAAAVPLPITRIDAATFTDDLPLLHSRPVPTPPQSQLDVPSPYMESPTPVPSQQQPELQDINLQSSPPRTPRQVVTFELSAKEATAHLQEELTATQCQVGAYKRMHEHAERRIEQLEAELDSMQHRARDAVEALQRRIKADKEKQKAQTSDATALEAVRRELEKVRGECREWKRQAEERGQEAVVLQSALVEAEDERDVYERQLRDLQQQQKQSTLKEGEAERAAAVAAELEKARAEAVRAAEALERRVAALQDEVRAAHGATREKESQLRRSEEIIAGLQAQCTDLEQQVVAEAEAKKKAVDTYSKQLQHYKKKSKTLAKKVEEVERELQVLGEEYTRVCDERDDAVLRYRTDAMPPARQQQEQHQNEKQKQPTTDSVEENTGSEQAAADRSFQSDGVPADSVSRDLSDALLSAKRGAASQSVAAATVGAVAISAALAHEREARVTLEKEVSALQSKVAAMACLATPSANSSLIDPVEPLPSADTSDILMPREQQQHQWMTTRTSAAPPRARSPQTTHALDLRFFDPTKSTQLSEKDVEYAGDRAESIHRESQRRRSSALPFSPTARRASERSGQPSQSMPSASPRRVPDASAAYTTQATESNAKAAVLDAVYADMPLPPVYHSSGSSTHHDRSAAGQPPSDLLLFSSTAGCLLVSKRGRHLHRPLVSTNNSDFNNNNSSREPCSCAAALASMSHAIFASRMASQGLFHLQHRYRFTIRVLADCDAGDVLVGFADRHVPLESFGDKCNALRYRGCYYASLHDGRLYAPSLGVTGDVYGGWEAAAEAAAERRWEAAAAAQGGRVRTAGILSRSASPSMEKERVKGRAVREGCVARFGDEIACVLHMDTRSIRYEWNGVDCGVAFTGVSLSPSLYPCVEVNVSGGTVELL